MIKAIKQEYNCNVKSGVMTLIFMLNYRLGRYLLERRGKLVFMWVPYLGCAGLSRFISLIVGCSVPFSCNIGNNVCFRHGLQGVFISGLAIIKNDCVIMHQVTIGSNFGSKSEFIAAPVIGPCAFIAPGAKIIGAVRIGAKAKVGPNAVVVQDVPESTVFVAPKAVRLAK